MFSVYPNPVNSKINVKTDPKLLESVYNAYKKKGKGFYPEASEIKQEEFKEGLKKSS